MTPFDPVALVAMLRAFYPIVGRAALARARDERPEYFAAGVLIGSSRTHLQLPDGRIFDLVFNEGAPQSQTRWQALESGVGDEVDDPFALEDGPLDPIDESIEWFPVVAAESFEAIAADELSALGASDQVLDRAGLTVAEFDGAGRIEDSYARLIAPAAEHHSAMRSALDADDPADEFEAAGLSQGSIDAALTEYDDEVPPELPEPDPGHEPPDEDPGRREPKIPQEA